MKMKYRIKKETMKNGDELYIPQWRNNFIPIWFDTKRYYEYERAKTHLIELKEDHYSNLVIKKTYMDY